MGNGPTTATNSTKILTDAVTKVLLDTNAQCNSIGTQNTEMIFDNLDFGGCRPDIDNITQESTQALDFKCTNTILQNSDIITKIKDEIKQQAEAKKEGLELPFSNPGVNSANSLLNSTNILTDINLKSISACMGTQTQDTKFSFSNVKNMCPTWCKDNPSHLDCKINIKNIKQSATQKGVTDCINTNTQLSKLLTDKDLKADQLASAINIGVSGAASLSMVSAILCGIIVLIMVVYFIYKNYANKSNSNNESDDYDE